MYLVRRDIVDRRGGSWHFTCSSMDGGTIYSSESALREAVRALARFAPRELFAFNLTPGHDHLGFDARRRDAGRCASAYHRWLLPRSEARLDRSFPTAIRNRQHLRSAARYIVTQAARELFDVEHPALWSGSCFLDLVGARHLPGFSLADSHGVDPSSFMQPIGLPGPRLPELTADEVRDLGGARVAAAAAAAAAADPALRGKSVSTMRARRAAIDLALNVGTRVGEIAAALGIHRSNVHSLRGQSDPDLVLATQRRLELEVCVARLLETGWDYDHWLNSPR